MTVTLHSVEAASTKKRDPQKYKWYQLAKGKAKFDSAHDEFELELRKGEKFGLKFYRGSYFLVDEDDLSVQFKLSADEGKKLISASKPFSGKVAGKKVEGGKQSENDAAGKDTPKKPSSTQGDEFDKKGFRIRKGRTPTLEFKDPNTGEIRGYRAKGKTLSSKSFWKEQEEKGYSKTGTFGRSKRKEAQVILSKDSPFFDPKYATPLPKGFSERLGGKGAQLFVSDLSPKLRKELQK